MRYFWKAIETARRTLATPSKNQWYESIGWLIATLLGGLLPLWGGYLLLQLKGASPPLAEFVRHGEFALYSASILAAACFLVLREWPSGFFPYRIIFGMTMLAGMLVATLIFAGVFEANQNEDTAKALNMQFLQLFSVGLYAIALASAYTVTLIDLVGCTVDPREVQAEQDAELASEFHALEEPKNG
jgi:hypothetical protein